MNRTLQLQTILLFMWIFACITQSSGQVWEKESGFSGTDFYTDVIEDANKGYTVFGAKNMKGNSLDFWIIRYNLNGDTLWTKTFGTEHQDIPKRITQLIDKSYILLGTSQIDKEQHLFLVRIDENGKELWRKIYEKAGYLTANDIISLDDGNFAITGSRGDSTDNQRIWMATMDTNGEIIWEKIFQDKLKGCAKAIKKLPGGGFAITGQVGKAEKNDCDIIAFRTNEKGTALWFSWIKTPNQKAWPECICCSPDSCFFVVGWKGKCFGDINSENPVFDFDMVLNKINCNGEILWTKSFDREGSEGGDALTIRPDGTLIVSGIKATSFLGKVGPWLLKVDTDGNELNEKLLRFRANNDHATRIINCIDGGFIVIGPGIQDQTNTRSNGWIAKFTGL